MRLELLHIDECPNSAKAYERLEAALTALGRTDVEVHMRLLESASDIEGTGFAGSPTITVNGTDIFPNGASSNDLACRIYMTPNGYAGLPTLEQLTKALRNSGL
ncbi:thioredoxin family protein [Pseudarthrobacter sp. NIBRBAC000502770]|uniref:thioredoxin family protein n=1 Tax=Pseudarthrobacter sp. NIBRBAC000502770 TaxID=2590785 RepID=UPI00114064D8|nr:thioredoxin family protein [Pseudarthrobacter sp. NIBRBAC000502770]QDG87079.1 thioredoxin family protein [Pseudarthrobacter sp. NIBRBAC000502770]